MGISTRREIDAYCIVCNVCWPITESERFAISLPGYRQAEFVG